MKMYLKSENFKKGLMVGVLALGTLTLGISGMVLNKPKDKVSDSAVATAATTQNWYDDAVKWAEKNGSSVFVENIKNNDTIDRAYTAYLLWWYSGRSFDFEYSKNYHYNEDLENGVTYSNSDYITAIEWAVNTGIMDLFCVDNNSEATCDKRFYPKNTVTRGGFITMLWRLDGSKVYNWWNLMHQGNFSDIPQDSVYYNPVKWAYTNKIANGYGDGMFHPDYGMTYAYTFLFLSRYYK